MASEDNYTDIPPPEYSESSASSSSLSWAQLPGTFSVGIVNTPPVVTVEDLQAHLRVLGAFSKLKEDVYHMNGGLQREKDQAWVTYVNRAVHRFNTFMGAEWESGFPGWMEETTPPLDVLMVLHSYLLVCMNLAQKYEYYILNYVNRILLHSMRTAYEGLHTSPEI
jgi:hypothetical protein